MPTTLSWLHISDIHFNKKTAWRDGIASDSLIDYLNNLFQKDRSLRPDLIFCTGDIANGNTDSDPLSDQYKKAVSFFERLLAVCGEENAPLSEERLFVVPGNHDVNRKSINEDAQETLVSWATNSDTYVAKINQRFEERPPVFRDGIKRLDEFGKFIELYLPHLHDSDGRHCFTRIVEINDLKVGIAGFNSAWSCAGPEDDRSLWLAAEWQFNAAKKGLEGVDLRIGLMHHPVDWLNPTERDLSTRRISTDFDFWLHGHSHNAWVTPGQSNITIAAGAVGAQSSDEFGINLVQLNLLELKGTIHLHKRKAGGTSWTIAPIECHATDGQWPLKTLPLYLRTVMAASLHSFPPVTPKRLGATPNANIEPTAFSPGTGRLPSQQQQKLIEGSPRIALLSANPINCEQQYTDLIKELRKIACSIDQFALNYGNLNDLHGYDFLVIASKVVRNRLLVEDEFLCSKWITFDNLKSQIGDEGVGGIFLFVDQLMASTSTAESRLPILIYAGLDKKQLESVVFKLFKKNDLAYFEHNKNCQVHNSRSFKLRPLMGRSDGVNNIWQHATPLPDNIDPKLIRHFIGRGNDLEQICRKLLVLDEGEVLTIKGSGGIGKTSTIKKVAVALSRRGYFGGGINFIDCESITDSQQFEFKIAGAFKLEQAEDLKSYLQNHHDKQARLVILDNFETLLYLSDSFKVKSLLEFISDYATIVITSRERLRIEGEIVCEVRQLTTDEAEELFISGLNGRQVLPRERPFLRQEIIENLLGNNPLAIKLITRTIPKGKRFEALKEDLELDLFSKISDSDLGVFDSNSDFNISRKKSIYGSILYSYMHLTENEQKAFELLSLFPDGIGLETFKGLAVSEINAKNKGISDSHTMISDRVIAALDNKSMIENNNGRIKLQSIVGKFAEAQLRQRDNIAGYYKNAFKYNSHQIQYLSELKKVDERRALLLFNMQQGNFLKSITFCDRIDIDIDDFIIYLDKLGLFFVGISSMGGYIRAVSTILPSFDDKVKQCLEAVLLQARYFDGDFDMAFASLKKLMPLGELAKLDRKVTTDAVLADTVMNIYRMEGDALYAAQYNAKHRLVERTYPDEFLQLGIFDQALLEVCKQDFFALEALANMGLLTLEAIDAYLAELYDRAHLTRLQVSYTRSKLSPIGKPDIEALVTVNPYTRGLKGLMLAFIELDPFKAKDLYEMAIRQMAHIKYYYTEALYFYARFLNSHNHVDFNRIHNEGLQLTQKHHYCFLQYRFEQILHPSANTYDACAYPLPERENFGDYIKYLRKEVRKLTKASRG